MKIKIEVRHGVSRTKKLLLAKRVREANLYLNFRPEVTVVETDSRSMEVHFSELPPLLVYVRNGEVHADPIVHALKRNIKEAIQATFECERAINLHLG